MDEFSGIQRREKCSYGFCNIRGYFSHIICINILNFYFPSPLKFSNVYKIKKPIIYDEKAYFADYNYHFNTDLSFFYDS